MTSGIQLIYQDLYSRPNLDPIGKAKVLSKYILELTGALSAADKIPDQVSASGAALDLLNHIFGGVFPSETDPDEPWLVEIVEGKRRKNRAAWAGYEPHSIMQKRLARLLQPTKRIDGRTRREPAEWQGLPFNDSVTLEALSWVRSEEKIFERQLHQKMQKVDGHVLRSRLKTLEKDGWIKSDREPDGAITYQSTFKLWDTGSPETRKARLPKPTFATPTERYHARTRAARVERIASLHKEPEAKKVLNAIRGRGPMQLKEIGLLLPGSSRLSLRDFMMELREGGWVECVGRGGGAAWTGTDQLMNSKI